MFEIFVVTGFLFIFVLLILLCSVIIAWSYYRSVFSTQQTHKYTMIMNSDALDLKSLNEMKVNVHTDKID